MKHTTWKVSALPMQILLILIIIHSELHAQKFTISGYLTDAANGEKLLNAAVFDAKTQQGTLTNLYGFYSLTLPTDSVDLVFSYGGFSTQNIRFLLDQDTSLSVGLDYVALDEVEIIADEVERKVDQTQMSTVEIPIEQIKRLPALLGEVDVIKALQYMPGVQSGNEGSSGLYVRGGGPDQNLILLDGVPLYYVSHLGGFFSVFNADALSSVQLYKGGFPARYGERLSSILDIRMKEGNLNKFEGEGSIGLISAKLSIQGPIQKGKTAFILSGRRTYIDLLSRPLSKAATDGEASVGYFFYDLNGKINHIISDKDRLYFSFYMGDDKFGGKSTYDDDFDGETYEEEFNIGLGWGNRLAALRWNHLWSDKLFSNLTATFTRYQLRTDADGKSVTRTSDSTFTDEFGLDYRSQIRDFGLKLDFDFYPSPNHEIKFGAFSTNHRFEPSTVGISTRTQETRQDTTLTSKIDYTWESGVYLEDNLKIGRRFSTNLGVRATHYQINDQSSWAIQARTAARYQLTDDVSIKGSYSQMTQFIHLLTNNGVGLPIDLWVPATERVPAQESWQVAGGLSASLWKDRYEFSLEGYYKEMEGLITFKEGNNFFFGGATEGTWEETVETGGTGESYGIEMLLQKKQGKTTGWIGYTLSWNWRQFDNIQLGERFPYKYDRRHDISLVVSHRISDRVSLAGTWVFGTGNAITLPTAGYAALEDPLIPNSFDFFGGNQGPSFSSRGNPFAYQLLTDISYGGGGVELFENGRNGFRMQAYHRMDLGIEFTKEKKWGQRTWAFGVYNAYSRLNPYVYYFENKFQNIDASGNPIFEKNLTKLALFPIIPSFSYRFKF